LTTRRTTAAAILPNLPQFVLIDESECDREMWFHGLDQVGLQLHAPAYNLGNFMRTLALPAGAEPGS
jgi:hypothetical protein